MWGPDEGELLWEGKPVHLHGPRDSETLGITTIYQDLALCDNLDIVQNMFLGHEPLRHRLLDEGTMEISARETLKELHVTTIRSIRQPVESLSGGQRQSVAVAKAVMSKAKLVILDEPTAALGVAQTRMVLSLIKRLESQGVSVLVVSHNLNDVFEVADRIVILYLGQMVAQGPVSEFDPASVVDYMTTGTSSRAVSDYGCPSPGRTGGMMPPDEFSGTGTPSELEERPLSTEEAEDATAAPGDDPELTAVAPEVLADSLGDYVRAWGRRIRSGESGALPIVVGLIVIIIFFQLERSRFGSAENLVNLFQQSAIYILLGAAEVFALILSEIDLSVGFVLGIGGFVIAELNASPVNFPWWLAILGGVAATAAFGYVQGNLITRLHVPSFVVTLAGLLVAEGLVIELATIDKSAVGGVISTSTTGPIFKLVNSNISPGVSWIILVVVLAIFTALSLSRAARRRAQGLTAPPLSITLLTVAITAVGGIALVYICSINRGLLVTLKGTPVVIPFVGVVLLVYSVMLGRTRLGRYMYAIGANPEAARRAGINVQRVRRVAFTLSAMTAGIAGLVYLSFLGSISTDVDGGTYTLYGVAAAVIGGASLFGGRGKPLHALLGGLVIAIVFNGLALMGINAAGQFIATGIVLLVAAAVDAQVRRRGAADGQRLTVPGGPAVPGATARRRAHRSDPFCLWARSSQRPPALR